MNLQDLRNMSRADAIQAAADFAGVSTAVVDGQWKQESNRGTHPTMISSAGAKGHFQSMDATHATWEKRLGTKLDRFDFTDSLFEYTHQMKENMGRYKNEDDALRAYFAGTNKDNWGPKTEDYVTKVRGKQGVTVGKPMSVSPAAAAPQGKLDLNALWNSTAADIKNLYPPEADAPVTRSNAVPGYGPDAASVIGDTVDAQAKQVQARNELVRDTPILGKGMLGFQDPDSKLGAAVLEEMRPYFRLMEKAGRASSPVDPAWVKNLNENSVALTKDFEHDDRTDLLQTGNKGEYDNAVFNIQERTRNQEMLGRASAVGGIGLGLAAGILNPVNLIAGIGATKAMAVAGYGSVMLATQGRVGAAIVSNAAEGALGNVATTAALQAMGEHKSISDYGLDAATGMLGQSLLGGIPTYRAALRGQADIIFQHTIAEQGRVFRQAQRELGFGAPQEALIARARELEGQQVVKDVQASTAPAQAGDRMHAPNLDEEPVVAEKVGEAAQAAPVAETTTTGVDAPMGATENAGWVKTKEGWTAPEGPRDFKALSSYSPELTPESIGAMRPGVHVAESVGKGDFLFEQGAMAARDLVSKYLGPEHKVILAQAFKTTMPDGTVGTPNGLVKSAGAGMNAHVIALQPGTAFYRTMAHEIGHIIANKYLPSASPEIKQGILDLYSEWSKLYKAPGKATEAMMARSPISRFGDEVIDREVSLFKQKLGAEGKGTKYAEYFGSFEEFMAEQFAKHVEFHSLSKASPEQKTMAQQFVRTALSAFKALLDFFTEAKSKGLVKPDERFEVFLADVQKRVAAGNKLDAEPQFAMAPPARSTNPTVVNNGLDLMPQGNPREKAEYKWAIDAFQQAEGWAARNPLDPDKIKIAGQNNIMNFATPGTILALSPHPVARMIAGTLLEQTTGAVTRRKTAAVAKYMHEQAFIGNALVDYDNAYQLWRGQNGGGLIEDVMNAEVRGRFDKEVMRYREGFNQNLSVQVHPQVKLAAEALTGAYTRMNKSQVEAQTVGWARLPASSEGYTPHNLAARRLQDSTADELRVFERIVSDQTQDIEGWDAKFSENFAKVYLQHARTNANGGHDIPMNVHNPAAADMVKGALQAMGMNKDEVLAAMGRFGAGGPSHTKKRLHLDLTTEYPGANGGPITLLDIFNTNQLELLRNQARRVSGEVALAGHGVMGSQGLTLLRRTLEFGPPMSTAERLRVLGAFDQVAAEFLGRPFGAQTSKFAENVLTLNSVAKLGGMGIPQLGEYTNAVWSLGIGHTLSAIGSVPRLRQELSAISRGQFVKNSILNSMEPRGGGGEFGAEGFKVTTPFDSPERAYASMGTDAVSWFDRALRKTSHAMGTLSMHRMIQAIQVRGIAEEITLKAIRFISDGGESKALADMGFTPDIVARLRADMPGMVVRDARGAVKEFDITKATDLDAAQAFIQAIHRGSKQIIQDSFIGERGKWMHDGHMKLFTQFKNYPLLAMEKQWGRQKGMHGAMGAVGILLGSMAMTMPLVYARVALNAQGRPDREDYLEKNTTPLALAKASLNYIGIVGMAPDLMELLQGAAAPALEKAGIPLPPEMGGGRGGVGGKGIVSRVVPAVGFIDDAYQGLTQLDPHKAVKALPLSNLPYLNPALNLLRKDN